MALAIRMSLQGQPSLTSALDMNPRWPVACHSVLRWVMPMMLAGFIGLTAGLVLKVNWAVKAGLVTAFSGLLLCGVGNAVPLGWSLVTTMREHGVRSCMNEVREDPKPWLSITLIFVTYSVLGVGGALLILAVLGVFK
jgi:hypothetical protein